MIDDIRQKAATGQYEYSKHAVDQTVKRHIDETYSEQHVTYTLEMDGKVYIVEHVPARVCLETGEQYFAPETVDKLQKIIWGQRKPVKVIETPVYEFGLTASAHALRGSLLLSSVAHPMNSKWSC